MRCDVCGDYEMGPKLYEEVVNLPEHHWVLDRIRSGFESTSAPRVVWKSFSNMPEVGPIGADVLDKHKRRFLRAEATGRLQTENAIYHVVGDGDEAT